MLVSAMLLAAAEGGAEAEETVNPILPVGHELFWGAVTFAVLWISLRYVLLPPVLKVMHDREERLRAARLEAESAVSGAGEAKAAYDRRIAEARTEANAVIAAAREEADAYRSQRVAEANVEIARLRDEAAAEVARAKALAIAQLRQQVAGVAVAAASRVVQKDLSLDAQLQVIEDYVNRQGENGGAR